MSTRRPPLPDGWERVCFRLQVAPDRIDEYRRRHAEVWPDMLHALQETGWHNYSLFLDGDGTLIGYFETPSLEAALAGMAGREVNARWQAEMSEFFLELDAPPDEGFIRLAEVFQLESQLENASSLDRAAPQGNKAPAHRRASTSTSVKETER